MSRLYARGLGYGLFRRRRTPRGRVYRHGDVSEHHRRHPALRIGQNRKVLCLMCVKYDWRSCVANAAKDPRTSARQPVLEKPYHSERDGGAPADDDR